MGKTENQDGKIKALDNIRDSMGCNTTLDDHGGKVVYQHVHMDKGLFDKLIEDAEEEYMALQAENDMLRKRVMTPDVIQFVKHRHTMNVDTGDGFTCMVCGHWLYESETEWGDLFVCAPKRFGHVHGTEPFRFCPNCGAMVLSPGEWAEVHPEDQGKTATEIGRRFYDGDLSAGLGSGRGRSNSDGGEVIVYRSKPDNDGE